MPLKPIDPSQAALLKEQGAVMVDIREPHEFARLSIPGSHNVALSALAAASLPASPGAKVIFYCASGNRTNACAAGLEEKAAGTEAYVMVGGIAKWRAAGLPVEGGGGGLLSRLTGR